MMGSKERKTSLLNCLIVMVAPLIVSSLFGIPSVVPSVMAFTTSHSNPSSPRASLAFARPATTTTTSLGLFSIKTNSATNKDDDGQANSPPAAEHDDDNDFPAWVKGLRQWPMNPPASSSKHQKQQSVPSLLDVSEQEEEIMKAILGEEEEEEETDAPPSASELPLATLINVEALLMASGEKTMEKEKDLALYELDSRKYMQDHPANTNKTSITATPLSFLPNLQEFGDWENMVLTLQKSLGEITDVTTKTSSQAFGTATETILKEATARLEFLVSEVSTAVSPQTVQDLVLRAGRTLRLNEGAANELVRVAENLAREQGLDVRDAAERARETTKFTAGFVQTANALLVAGYAAKDTEDKRSSDLVDDEESTADVPLFHEFESARLVADADRNVIVNKAAELGTMSGAIYQDMEERTFQLGHSIVANGTTANVVWLVTDSIAEEASFSRAKTSDGPFLVRTITIRGFDASDENVDREQLLVDICTAPQEPLGTKGVFVHGGLLKIARAIYADILPYIDTTAPSHKIVVNGHSVGGSLSSLLLLLLAEERGAQYVKERIARVYAFGSPPIATTKDLDPSSSSSQAEEDDSDQDESDETGSTPLALEAKRKSQLYQYECEVLKRFGLPSDIVYGYIQPWDPIARLFSEIDPLYPLLGDLGEDGKTLYASGPARTLRPITRAIIESWEGWPRFRDNFRATVSQNYTSLGIQHILLSEPVRYLSDRLVAVNVQVPPLEKVLRISSQELLPALDKVFPLDVFSVSFVPAAIRSFLHHFYPAYGFPIVDYADKKKGVPEELNKSEREDYAQAMKGIEDRLSGRTSNDDDDKATKSSQQWLQFPSDW